MAASALLGFVFIFGPVLVARGVGSGPLLRFEPGPNPWPYGVTAAAILCPFAAVGLARAERRGCAAFGLGILAVTLLVPAVLGASPGLWASSGVPILLLGLYGSFGALSLTTRLREPAAETG